MSFVRQFPPLLGIGCLILALAIAPPFYSRVVMGSEISGGKMSILTKTSNKFISSSLDDPVGLNYDISITELMKNTPSEGYAKAFMTGILQEGRADSSGLYQQISFEDFTSVHGSITTFKKSMTYTSGFHPGIA